MARAHDEEWLEQEMQAWEARRSSSRPRTGPNLAQMLQQQDGDPDR
jgi:hypothetical protein